MHTILGPKPPKAARDDYDRFRGLAGTALGQEVPFEEVAAATEALWIAISAVSKPATDQRLSSAALLQPFRWGPAYPCTCKMNSDCHGQRKPLLVQLNQLKRHCSVTHHCLLDD